MRASVRWMVLGGALTLGGLVLASQRVPADFKEGDPVFHTHKFPVKLADGRSFDCERREMGTYTRRGPSWNYLVGTIDFECSVEEHDFQLECRVTWGPERFVSPGQLTYADATASVHYLSLRPTRPGQPQPQGGQTTLAHISAFQLNQVVREFFRDQCFAYLP